MSAVKSEYQEQCELFEWIRAKSLSKTGNWWKLAYAFATLNGVRLTIGQATKAKRSGNVRGVPDVQVPVANMGFHGLFIEMKVKGSTTSKEQKEFLKYLSDEGYSCHVCFSASEAIKVIEWYL